MTRSKIAAAVFLTFAFAGAAHGDAIISSGPGEVILGTGILVLILTVPICSTLLFFGWGEKNKLLFVKLFLCIWLVSLSWMVILSLRSETNRRKPRPYLLGLMQEHYRTELSRLRGGFGVSLS